MPYLLFEMNMCYDDNVMKITKINIAKAVKDFLK